LACGSAVAQTTINPDITVIPRFLVITDDGQHLDEGNREFSTPDLQFQEMEIGFQGYLNPYARADVFIALKGPDLENVSLGLEEAYLTVLRGLPLDLNVRLGKYRVEFGKLNMLHPHAWPFVSQPALQGRFLGGEGLNDLGVSLSALLPTGDLYTKLTVDLLRGYSVTEAAGREDTADGSLPYAVSGRLTSFFTLGSSSDLELGLSALTGIHDPYERERFWYGNLDVKYKYRPSSYTSLTVQGEGLLNTRASVSDGAGNPFLDADGNPESRRIITGGAYLFVDYQFEKIFDVGTRLDWAESPYGPDDRARGVALFFGYYPVEETVGLRLEYQHLLTESAGVSRTVNTIGLQVMFSLGPHRAHAF
jgi:hypothetical protein